MEAFSDFYRAHMRRVVALLLRQGATPAEAADAAQEAMIKAFERWDLVHGMSRPDAWVRTVATREFVRRRTRRRDAPSAEPFEVVTSLLRDSDADHDLVRRGEEEHVLSLINNLPSRQRQVLAWIYDGYTLSEIADLLNMTPATVRSHLSSARSRLRSLLMPMDTPSQNSES